MAGTCDCGIEPSGSILCGEFELLRTSQFLKDSAPWSECIFILPYTVSFSIRKISDVFLHVIFS